MYSSCSGPEHFIVEANGTAEPLLPWGVPTSASLLASRSLGGSGAIATKKAFQRIYLFHALILQL